MYVVDIDEINADLSQALTAPDETSSCDVPEVNTTLPYSCGV